MSVYQNSVTVRRWLLLDAIISGATGLLMFGGAAVLGGILALPQPLLRYAGLSLLPFAAFVAYLAALDRPRRTAVWAVVAINALWALGSIGLLLGGSVTPNVLGYAFVVFQAVVVAAFGELQYFALRRAGLPRTA